MSKAGVWTAAWVAAVCVAGGARLMKATPHSAASVNSDLEAISTAQRLGIPIDQSAIQSPLVPESQNSAEIYREAQSQLDGDKKLEKSLLGTSIRPDFPEQTPQQQVDAAKARKANDALLPDLKPLLRLADQLESRRQCNFSQESTPDMQSRYAAVNGARNLTKVLCVSADFQDRHCDANGALKTLRLADRVCRDIDSNPGFMNLLVGSFAHTILCREYQTLVARHSNDLPFLSQLETQVAAARSLPDMRRCAIATIVEVRPEIKFMNSIQDVNEAYGGGSSNDDDLGDRLLTGARLQDRLDASLLTQWIDVWPKLPKDSTDWQAYYRLFKPYSQGPQTIGSPVDVFDRSQFSNLVTAADQIGEMQATDRLLLDSIKLLKIRAATGKLPPVLPAVFGQDRIDPFDGNPLRYRADGKGFMLYSVGSDRIDNGGHRSSLNDGPGAGVDIVFSFS